MLDQHLPNQTSGYFANGEWLSATGEATFQSLNPTTGDLYATVANAGAADLERCIVAASRAQAAWAALPPAARSELFHRAANLFVDRQDQFVQALIKETGSGLGKAMFECSLVPLALREAAALTTREIGEILPSHVPGKLNRTYRTPIGVVGVVTPWNFPLYLSLRGFIYALALGNTIVLKPSEDSPLVGGLMIAQLFADAGFPAGTLNVATTDRDGAAAVGDTFVSDPRINVVCFTGSTQVGQKLAEACARNFKPIMLELGGKNPMIVMEDADVERAVDLAFFGSFLHQGQICMSCDKVLVAQGIYDEFLSKLVAKAKNFVPTNPEEQTCVNGPIINGRQLDRITAEVNAALAAGATAECGGAPQAPFYQTRCGRDGKRLPLRPDRVHRYR